MTKPSATGAAQHSTILDRIFGLATGDRITIPIRSLGLGAGIQLLGMFLI